MSYLVDLEAFHGPLDLLLFLIDKNEMNIYDIPIALITDQYIEHLGITGDFDLENIGEFLLMATYLLNLKSKTLLPRQAKSPEDEADEIDPREELVQKLLDYRRYREAGQYLQEREAGILERVFYRELPEISPRDEELIVDLGGLVRAYRALIRRLPSPDPETVIPEGDVNVADKMNDILNMVQGKGPITFVDLFAGSCRRRECLAMFLALLELIRLQKVTAVQSSPWEDIQIEMWRVFDHADA